MSEQNKAHYWAKCKMVEVAGVVPSEGNERQDRAAKLNRTTAVRRTASSIKKACWINRLLKNGGGGGSRTRFGISSKFTNFHLTTEIQLLMKLIKCSKITQNARK